ncbi:TIGR02677 family protein [Ramlibacter sp. AN1133]|uniref:TIGR02677 family protein n=1 Tax=Ramlibacter sp. AN1133 TaxID=3133429 RepID=UPI0030C421A0
MKKPAQARDLFRHLTADKAFLYRSVLEAFAAAKRQYRLQLRPDEVLAEAAWEGAAPAIEEVNAALSQLAEWGNLESQPDMARVTTLADYYRARFLYRLSQGGEAVEGALDHFEQAMKRRAELQTVALEDIDARLRALRTLLDLPELDAAKLHEVLRDLTRVFESLAENAQSFMAGVARSVELQRADVAAVIGYKRRLIDYLDRFIGDLVHRSESIANALSDLGPRMRPALLAVAQREARDAAPGDAQEQTAEEAARYLAWRERWQGLSGWFMAQGHAPAQGELLRARARAAIPQLLAAIAAVNERRSGRSDRSADFRILAGWFLGCADDAEAHRLARAAFALNPARHLAFNSSAEESLPASTPWASAPPLAIHPRLREYGEAAPRGPQARVKVRDQERAALAAQLEEESRQVEAARARLATGRPARLSELGVLQPQEFGLFLSLLGEALAEQPGPDAVVERATGDGLFRVRLQPLEPGTHATIETPAGAFTGRDHLLTVTPAA